MDLVPGYDEGRVLLERRELRRLPPGKAESAVDERSLAVDDVPDDLLDRPLPGS